MNEGLFKVIDSVVYSFHMPLFFFLSGLFFVSSLHKRGLTGFIANKLDSIFYLYVVWSVLQGGISLACKQWTNNNVTQSEIFSLLLEPSMQFWFLYALFFITLISALIFAKIDQKYALILLVLSSLIVIFSVSNYGFTPFIYVLPNFVFFIFGIYFNQIESFFTANKQKLLLPLTLLFVGIHWLVLTQLSLVPAYLLPAINLTATLISILFSVNLCMCLADKPSKLLSTIGASSMVIFLAHVIMGSGTRIMLQHFLGVNNYWLHITFGCLMGIFGSMLLAKLLSKIGFSFLFEVPKKLSIERNTKFS